MLMWGTVQREISYICPHRRLSGTYPQNRPALVGPVLGEASHPAPRRKFTVTTVGERLLDAELLKAVVQLVRLLYTPTEARSSSHTT
jgi:hypothetical protein